MHITKAGSAIVLHNFLSKSDRDSILNYAVGNADRFTASTVTSNDASYRISKVLYDFEPHQSFFTGKIRSLLPLLCDRLSIPQFDPTQIECQLTSSANGSFFKRHQDSGDSGTAKRKITFVYYLREPGADAFSGGNLLLWRSHSDDALETIVTPEDNAMIVFQSSQWHSVDTVYQDGDDMHGSRLTVNGWCRD